MNVLKNPTPEQIAGIITASQERAARRITDPRNGDVYVWDAAEGTHREGADQLGVAYDLRPGEGEILTL